MELVELWQELAYDNDGMDLHTGLYTRATIYGKIVKPTIIYSKIFSESKCILLLTKTKKELRETPRDVELRRLLPYDKTGTGQHTDNFIPGL